MTLQPVPVDPIDTVANSLLQALLGGALADDHALQGHIATLDQAYAVQDRLLALLDTPAGEVRHWKSGGPSRTDAMRHAPLPARGVRSLGDDLAGLHLGQRRIEAEVALRIAHDVTPAQARVVCWPEACGLVDAMCVSIELVDSRWARGRAAAPLLKLADLLVHGALVLGEFVPYTPRDWAQQECRVRIGASEVLTFRGSLGVGHPGWVLPAFVRHATRHGATLAAGTVVSTGTWCGLLEAQVGEWVEVEFPGIGAASVQC
jgi:2-keto-4-pentenoate hydratase